MLSSFALLSAGALLLVGGGEALVRAASALALRLRLTPTVIGLTVMALGTSLPELVVSVRAQLDGSADIALANVVGSNLFNLGLVLGFTAILVPLNITGSTVRLEWPFMFFSTVLVAVLAHSGGSGYPSVLDGYEGVGLLLALVIFTTYMIRLARRETTAKEKETVAKAVSEVAGVSESVVPLWKSLTILALGCVALKYGSDAFVKGACEIGAALGLSERVIGLTIVAAGTGAPEWVSSLMAAWRGKTDMAVGNVIGSNIFNLLGILGVASMVRPLPANPAILGWDMWWLLAASLALGPLLLGRRIQRWEGAVITGLYLAFAFSLYWRGN